MTIFQILNMELWTFYDLIKTWIYKKHMTTSEPSIKYTKFSEKLTFLTP